ncbi:RNA polymerase sigma factor [Dinghuibacter silviterrae]|uniref:RNA polymerase sigma factor (Sigma-70 family) n=1 Tax=Dinghuibacter silviterrae TaxID=1539049 RepID=A0A4V3GKZ4_9BACT|nr:sigma-70 family RNA polymerase sigma factor [Dinghuibacter silviterrae]TDW97542.1 RNA polymerase sigma factor (sigma-70 family) [Dinghuibacter silviterrae]
MNSEGYILERLRDGDEGAFTALMERYYDTLYRYGHHFTKDDDLLTDCIQDVFVTLWQNRHKLEAINYPRQYLLTALKRRIIRLSDRERKMAGTPADDYAFSLEFSVEDLIVEKQLAEEKASKLRQILDQLPARQKEVIYLVYYQKLDPAQVAELMRIHRQSVYNLLSESLRKIKEFWLESSLGLTFSALL